MTDNFQSNQTRMKHESTMAQPWRNYGPTIEDCLNEITTILYNANKCMLFNSSTDTEKTIFNYYLIEIIPILNKFYDKLIDVKLPKVLEDLVSEEKFKLFFRMVVSFYISNRNMREIYFLHTFASFWYHHYFLCELF